MERVKKGEKYYVLLMDGFGIYPLGHRDYRQQSDELFFEAGNYFNTKEEAETLVRKLQAVLKGAEVIEMPSEEEIKERFDTIMPHGPVESWCVEGYCKHILDWLKSKIVK